MSPDANGTAVGVHRGVHRGRSIGFDLTISEPRVSEYVYDFLGGCIPLKKIERSYGYSANSQGVQNWIDTLLTDQWAEEHATPNGY